MIQFNSKVHIMRVSKAKDGMGGYSEAEGILIRDLPCRINWSRGEERIQFDKNTYYRDAKLYCRIVDVTIKDRVQYKDESYEIVNISNVDSMNVYLILDIRLIK